MHYETIGDLLEECARHIINRFTEFMPYDTKEFLEKLKNRPLEELCLVTPEYLIPYLNYIKENRCVFKVTVEQFSVLRMDDAYNGLKHLILTPILERFCVSPEKQKYMIPFYINGLIAIIDEWLKDDCRDPVEQVISVMQICIKQSF